MTGSTTTRRFAGRRLVCAGIGLLLLIPTIVLYLQCANATSATLARTGQQQQGIRYVGPMVSLAAALSQAGVPVDTVTLEAGHALMTEQPDATLDALFSFASKAVSGVPHGVQ